MRQRFFLSWLVVYAIHSLSGYFIHDIVLHKTYMALMPTLHSENIKNKIWAFIISSVVSTLIFTWVYSKWRKKGTIGEGILYGFFLGAWIGIQMSLNTYASTGLIPFSLAIQWFVYALFQEAIVGGLLAFVYNYRANRSIEKE
ncbi:MAG TPA: hypothetical protein VG870_08295 [Chitinophagaceae bacterium]|nr:hypothetical protein [Chitinophagaceae bacterium]